MPSARFSQLKGKTEREPKSFQGNQYAREIREDLLVVVGITSVVLSFETGKVV